MLNLNLNKLKLVYWISIFKLLHDERVIFLLERDKPIESNGITQGFTKDLNSIDWKDKDELEMYIFSILLTTK